MSEAPRRNKLWLWSRSSATLIVCITDSLALGLPSTGSQRKGNIAGMCKCWAEPHWHRSQDVLRMFLFQPQRSPPHKVPAWKSHRVRVSLLDFEPCHCASDNRIFTCVLHVARHMVVAWDDRSKPTVDYGSLASGRGAGWPEDTTIGVDHRRGESSCIVSSKVNPERDAQELGIIGYDHDRHSRPMAPRLDEPQTVQVIDMASETTHPITSLFSMDAYCLCALKALGRPPPLYERVVTKDLDAVDFSLRPAIQEQAISGWLPHSIVVLESCTLFCLPVPKSCLLVACKRRLQSSCRTHRGSLSVITTGVVPTTSHRFVRRGASVNAMQNGIATPTAIPIEFSCP
ncbi:uncharacterized protein FPRO_10943 [Fusarium proliferatum ET1]|uniref:Uncharacterized protein n=1 Tax=Fusarium proliferatum (strain ET1) TaxID=1227346 RepID=A0A1L7VLQ5_FUSPR|nr:uncharacterized protein FPRO_10943 [Fusarium proliferatum ET1]CZR41354.1 uncharacterized protein FPRO_10943 [Fusarium proliferatum ET1]